MRLLIVDNYDSFTYNLFQALAEATGEVPVVLRNDEGFHLDDLRYFDAVVISPGPGHPERREDFGISGAILAACEIPLLGVCLGYQGLCTLCGGEVVRAPEAHHGRLSPVVHGGSGLFAGIASPFRAVRYHSLAVARLAGDLEAIARTDDGVLMAVRHLRRPAWGVQFHPESICTEYGGRLLENFVALSRGWHRGHSEERHGRRNGTVRPAESPSAESLSAKSPSAKSPSAESPPAESHYQIHHRKLALDLESELVFETLYGGSERAFWLDSSLETKTRTAPRLESSAPASSGPAPDLGRFSIMGDASGPWARLALADVWEERITVETAAGVETYSGRFFDWLEADLRGSRIEAPAFPFDFALGWVGYLGYELKSECGGRRAHRAATPDAAMIFADRALVFDHREGDVYLLALAEAGSDEPARRWLERTATRLFALAGAVPSPAKRLRLGETLEARHDREGYLRLIAACQEKILAGESYEICLTNEIRGGAEIDPWEAYLRLRRQSPAPFAAFLRFGSLTVLSSSPERFLRISKDRVAESKPIKGTRPRSASPREDARLRSELLASEKDRAENLMIVDLVRSDLGRSAQVGSVHVPKLFDVESYASVHHLVSTVRARLRPDVSPVRAVANAFPGGSMTGAPKIRTMHILDELEAGPRGVYSGALGYFSLTGAADLSMVIRTLVLTEDRLSFGVGGAVIALSEPEAEFDETVVKATAILEILGAAFPDQSPSRDGAPTAALPSAAGIPEARRSPE